MGRLCTWFGRRSILTVKSSWGILTWARYPKYVSRDVLYIFDYFTISFSRALKIS